MQPGGVLAAKQPAATERSKGFGLAGTYATGIIYGLQPDALFVIVPALALPTKLAAGAYMVGVRRVAWCGVVWCGVVWCGGLGCSCRACSSVAGYE